MRKHDPNGIFLNNFGRRITGASSQLTVDARVKHCALQSHCICSSNVDCAPGQICGKLFGFNVCKDFLAHVLPLGLSGLLTSVSDTALTTIADLFSSS